MKILLVFFSLFSLMYGARVVESRWLEGQSFSGYLSDRNASVGLIRNISADDKQFLSEIQSGEKFYELFSRDGTLLQALIPIGEEMQIQIIREKGEATYSFDIVPINYVEREHKALIPIRSNPHTDVSRATNNRKLSDKIYYFFKNHVDCRKLQKMTAWRSSTNKRNASANLSALQISKSP